MSVVVLKTVLERIATGVVLAAPRQLTINGSALLSSRSTVRSWVRAEMSSARGSQPLEILLKQTRAVAGPAPLYGNRVAARRPECSAAAATPLLRATQRWRRGSGVRHGPPLILTQRCGLARVARRLAHEIKNPLYPDPAVCRAHGAGSLRRPGPAVPLRGVHLRRWVKSIAQALVDEFAQFARLPGRGRRGRSNGVATRWPYTVCCEIPRVGPSRQTAAGARDCSRCPRSQSP